MQNSDYIRIPKSTYQELLDYLEEHAVTDSSSAELLLELEQKARPAYILPSGGYVLSEKSGEYRVN